MRPSALSEDTHSAHPLLASLLEAIIDGAVLPWAVEHARDGDPIPRAWAECTDGWLMYLLLNHAQARQLGPAIERLRPFMAPHWNYRAAWIRECVPSLTFAEIMSP